MSLKGQIKTVLDSQYCVTPPKSITKIRGSPLRALQPSQNDPWGLAQGPRGWVGLNKVLDSSPNRNKKEKSLPIKRNNPSKVKPPWQALI